MVDMVGGVGLVVQASFVDRLVDSGRLPLAVLFLAFLVTFIATRSITRMIRAGRGPFHNNIVGGTHIHHAVPGLILLITGAFLSVGTHGIRPWAEISGALIGIGASLVLDEFALILHLQDVYWSPEGQLSVQVTSLALAVLGLALLGINPLTAGSGWGPWHWLAVSALPIHVAAVLLCIRKGKFSTAAVGAFLPPVAWVGAARLARPRSSWAKKHYSPTRLEDAEKRAQGFDARFGQWGLNLADLVAGHPSRPNPTAPAPKHPSTT